MQDTTEPSSNTRGMLVFMAKAFVGLVLFLGSIAWVDNTGLFQAPPDENPHIEKRWSSLQSLAEQGTNVDLLVLGNSHAYTGINPKHLSAELGMTAMVMANNSMSWTDSYWTLKAALAHCKPQVVVVETYGLDEHAPGERGLAHLVNQIRAFKARRSPLLQLQSAPDLFTLEELGLGLSPTIRNHHYVWESPEILAENWERGEPRPLVEDDDLFLGRFVRFTSGLTAETLAKYDSLGAVVDGATRTIHEANRAAGEAIVALCEEVGADLVMLTLPMYHRHVDNPEPWFERIDDVRQQELRGAPWLNLQADSSMILDPDFFEDTYTPNQHMTYNGSRIASHKLAQFLEGHRTDQWADRTQDTAWHAMMANCEGFYAHQEPMEGSERGQVLGRDLVFKGLPIESVIQYANESVKSGQTFLQFRITDWPAELPDPASIDLVTTWEVELPEKGRLIAPTKLRHERHLSTPDVHVFRTVLIAGAQLKALRDIGIEERSN